MSLPDRRPLAARTRLRIEPLEDRVVPSWGSVPPATVTPPASPFTLNLNSSGDISGTASITNNEIDWYRMTVAAGSTTVSATTPTSSLDTVLGIYTTGGSRVAFNDDISSTNRDSRVTTSLAAGTYLVGVTNYVGTPGGSYTLSVNAPPPVAPPPPPPPPPTAGGFDIEIRVSGLSASQQAVFDQAAARWERVIVGDLPDATVNGQVIDDVRIDASGVAIDGAGGVLGQAGPTRLRSGSSLPVTGVMEFDTADLASLEAQGQLFNVIVHEMGHVLGIGTIWTNLGLLSGGSTSNPRFTGPQATAAYNQIFGTTAGSVPVENTGGAGTRNGHWRESVFGNELMTGFLNGGTNPLSRVTVASLADMGYQVDLSAADAYTPPAGSSGGLRAGGGTGGGGGLRGLWSGGDGGCGCPLCMGMLRTDPVAVASDTPQARAVGARADWADDDGQEVAVAVADAPVVRRAAAVPAVEESARPATPATEVAGRVTVLATTPADDLLLGVLVG